MPASPSRVIALMSGGVDSSVAAALLLRRGYDVRGITFLLRGDSGRFSCPPPRDDAGDARRVADALGIPHRVVDLRDLFRKTVVEPFIEEYARGRTPNPCVMCNPLIKFGAALDCADRDGAAFIATGHYARIGRAPGGGAAVMKAADLSRDQSYFLYRVAPAALERTIFPLGGLTKDRVRSLAGELGLAVADKADSQEVCFIPGGRTALFLRDHIPLCSLKPGVIRLRDGSVLGCHDGIHAFTVGQRRGLGLSAGRPLYVLEIDAGDGGVTVGDEGDLLSTTMRVADLHWAVPPPAAKPLHAVVRIRYRHMEVSARIWTAPGEATVIFDKPQRAVTPGQSAVFYDDNLVLGGGVIEGPG